jgi:hypothetical protein
VPATRSVRDVIVTATVQPDVRKVAAKASMVRCAFAPDLPGTVARKRCVAPSSIISTSTRTPVGPSSSIIS